MTQKERKRVIKRLDVLFSKYIRKRDGRCLHCGRSDSTLQCSHIAGRKSLAGRWNEKNAITLCTGCHLFWWHKEPVEASNWLKENYPEYYQTALEVRRTTVKNLDLNELIIKYSE